MDIEGKIEEKPVVERKVKVKTMESQIYQMSVPSNILISDFKKKLHEVSGTPPDRQRLICKAKLLLDEKPLDEYIQEDDQFIHLLKTQVPEQDGPQQPPRRTEAEFNNTLGAGNTAQGQGAFNPFSALGGLFGNLGIPQGQANIIHINTTTASQPLNRPAQQGAHPHHASHHHSHNHGHQQPVQQAIGAQNQGARYVAANQRVNELIGVGPHGMDINLRNYDQIGNQLEGSTVMRLPHISNLTADLYGHQNMSHWPLLPRDEHPQNSMTVIGNYLHSLNLQINLLLPAIQRFSEIAQREAILRDPIERQRLMVMGHQLGRAFQRLALCLEPCSEILRNLRVLQNTGEFGIMVPPSRPVSARTSNQGAQNENQPQQAGTQNPQIVTEGLRSNSRQNPTGGANIQGQPQQPPNPFANLGNIFSGLGGGAQAGGQGSLDLGSIINDLTQQLGAGNAGGDNQQNPMGGLSSMINQMFGGIQQQGEQAPAQAQPQQPRMSQPAQGPGQGASQGVAPQNSPPPTIAFQTTEQGPNSQSFSMTTNPNAMSTRMRDFSVSVNNQARQDDKDFVDVIIGSLEAQEVIALMSGNGAILDTRHADIKADVTAFIELRGGMEGAQKNFVKSTENLFLEGLQNNPNVYEGFEPAEVTKEIAKKHFHGIIECIQRSDYAQEDRFSDVD